MSIGAESRRNRRVQGKNAQGRTEEVVEIDIETLTMEQMGRVTAGTINSWDLLKNVFILRYCPPSRTAKQSEDINNFRQEGNEMLYQALERAFVVIQAMASHSQKLYDKGGDRGLERSSSNGMNAIINKFSDLGSNSPLVRRFSLEETIQRYLEESNKRQDNFEEWMKRFRESTNRNLKRHDYAIKGLEKKVEQLAQAVHLSITHESKSEIVVKTCERNETPKSTPVIGNFADTFKRRIAEEQERMFLENLERVPVNTPLIDTIRKTPDYTKSLQELNELPPKEKDPRSFIFPCVISNMTVSNALADLGASINVIPFYLFKCLGMGNPRPIRMLIEMADKSMQSPKGIIENVLTKIDRFIFLVDFVILDIVEDDKVSIIIGRPILATAHARIVAFGKNIFLEVGGRKSDV
nr:hypothetical protein [Tanacetum cinerariifolium]